MKTKFLVLLCFIFAHYTYGTDVSEPPRRPKPMWFRVAQAKRKAQNQNPEIIVQSPGIVAHNKVTKYSLKDLRINVKEHLKTPLPKVLIFKKTYDFFADVPEKLHPFMKNILKLPNLPDGAKIVTLPGWLDKRGHVTEGRIGNTKVILKRSKRSNDPNERKVFYEFMDVVKEKLRELATIPNDNTLSEEEKKIHSQR
ncbi:MAG: hypothetical protein LBB05_01125, partial [Puniceicoccales bacterium]|nr:hypothetical protein [Puniceicoccales bacterium]